MKVHLCCGDVYLEGYENVDIYGDLASVVPSNPNITTMDNYYKKELYEYQRPVLDKRLDLRTEWDYNPNTIDEFLMICAIEHFPKDVGELIIERVHRSLKDGGRFRFDFPDIHETILQNNENPEHMMRLIYGSGKNEWGFHRWGFTRASIQTVLNKYNWKNIEFKEIIPHAYPMIGVEATK